MEVQDNSTYRARPRFSLLSLVLVTTIVALAFTAIELWRERLSLNSYLEVLRSRNGELHIKDASNLHVLCVRTDMRLTSSVELKWRVWVPEGITYRVSVVARGDKGVIRKSVVLATPGEHPVRFSIGGNSALLQCDEDAEGFAVSSRAAAVAEYSNLEGRALGTRVYAPQRKVDLLANNILATNQPRSRGEFSVWLEPAEVVK